MRWKQVLGGVLLCPMAACAWWMAGRPGLNTGDQLIFSHLYHIDQGADCTDCHVDAPESTDMSTTLLPVEATCMDCHDRDTCTNCHTHAEIRKPRPPHESHIRFSHKAHLERVEDGCLTCHPNAETVESTKVVRPKMAVCLSCHGHAEEYAQAKCSGCHPTMRQIPLRAIAEFNHNGDWVSRHGLVARSSANACLQCHTQNTCNECHSSTPAAAAIQLAPSEVVSRTLMHRGDFATSHAIDARADGDTCLRCHNVSSCSTCHSLVGLTPEGTDPRSPHPAGYGLPGGVAFHGRDARRRVETCAACHDQGPASNCVTCHGQGGIGGNPHPPGYEKRHPNAEIADNVMCLYCHQTQGAVQ